MGTNVGHQQFWLAGSRLHFIRDDVAGVKQPLIDMGVIQSAPPSIETTKIDLKDPDGGYNKTVAEEISEITETYEITCNNFNQESLAIMFAADGVNSFTQLADPIYRLTSHAIPGRLFKVFGADGKGLFNLTSIIGVAKKNPYAITAVDTTGPEFSFGVATDVTAQFTVGKKLLVQSNAGATANKIYTVVSSSFGSGTTTIIVTEDNATATVSGVLSIAGVQDTDWEVHDLVRGTIRIKSGSTVFASADTVEVAVVPTALSGLRSINPQTVAGSIYGKAFLYIGRKGNAYQHVRECYVSLTPSSSNIGNTEFSSWVFTMKVISDVNSAGSAGRLVAIKGDLPSAS